MKFTSRDLSLKRTPSKKQSGVFGVKINVVTKYVCSCKRPSDEVVFISVRTGEGCATASLKANTFASAVLLAGGSAPRCLTLSASASRKWRRGELTKWESTGSQGWPLTSRPSKLHLTPVRLQSASGTPSTLPLGQRAHHVPTDGVSEAEVLL